MNTEQYLFSRRSIREYDDTQVKKSEIVKMIEAAMIAPSACNRQAWKFIWVTDKALKSVIAYEGSPIIEKAPSGILVTYRNDLSYNAFLYKDYFQSAAAAIENMLLEASYLGLGACWICNLQRPKVLRRKLNIPKTFDIIAYISLGYPKKDESLLSVNHYGSLDRYKEHKRNYSMEQVLCKNAFLKVPGDCTELKGKNHCKWFKYFYKLNIPYIKNIENRL